MKRVLIAGMDEAAMQSVRATLEREEYEVIQASSTSETLARLYAQGPDLVILEKGAPSSALDPWQTCRLIREVSNISLIAIVGEKKDADKLKSLELGADDCLVRPFAMAELAARMEALLRRAMPQRLESRLSVYLGRDLMVNFHSGEVFIRGERLRLSNMEYRVLAKLVHNAGRTLSHEQLLECMDGDGAKGSKLRLRGCIRRLRQKIEKDPYLADLITTRWGEGYRFERRDVT
jgi:two-component system KDP operon response regulator KdpE